MPEIILSIVGTIYVCGCVAFAIILQIWLDRKYGSGFDESPIAFIAFLWPIFVVPLCLHLLLIDADFGPTDRYWTRRKK